MEESAFDRMTRALTRDGETRRAVVRFLVGGALGGLAVRFVPAESAAAKRNTPKAKRRAKRTPHATLQAEGKGKGKGNGKGKGKGKGKKGKGKGKDKGQKTPPLPPGCQACTECQMCQEGTCVPDPDLTGVRCLGSGAACGYCQGGQCVASVIPPCADGVCPPDGQCCSEEKRCPDSESNTGFACIDPATMCCPDERRCASGCVYHTACCEEKRPSCGQCGEVCVKGTWQCSAQKPCADGTCVAEDACCPEEWTCGDGSCVAQEQCCADERRCPNDACVSEGVCCSGEKLCPDGSCIAETACCPTGSCRPGLEWDPGTCACRCPENSVACGVNIFCCPADTYACWWDYKPHINFCYSSAGTTCPFGYSGDQYGCLPT